MFSRRNFLAFAAVPVFAQDWPQWRGPARDGAAPSDSSPQTWPEKLRQVWKISVGEGHSSPVVVGNKVFQFARQNDREIAAAYDLANGKKLWEYAYSAPYEMNQAANGHGKGPKSTPLVTAGKLYTLGMTGVVACLDAATGKQVWRYDSAGKWRRTSPTFGVSASPLLSGQNVIIALGTDKDGALAAFDSQTGKVQWEWKGDGPAYASPMTVKTATGIQIVTFSSEKLIGINAADGSLIWQIPFTTPYTQNSVTPFVTGDVIVYSGLSNPVTAVKISASAPQKLWENGEAGMYMSSPVMAAGLLHGLTHRNKGQFFSLDPRTGKTVWTSEGRRGENAMLVSRADTVFALTDNSELSVLRATAKGLDPQRKYTVADSPTWAHPVILGNRVLIKDKDSLALWIA